MNAGESSLKQQSPFLLAQTWSIPSYLEGVMNLKGLLVAAVSLVLA